MKKIFYFSRRERRIIAVFMAVLVLAMGGWMAYNAYFRVPRQELSAAMSPELAEFMGSVIREDTVDSALMVRMSPRRFDPNQCDSVALLSLGIRPRKVHVYLNYRRAGARFYAARDFWRVYGLDSVDVSRLASYAVFPKRPAVMPKIVRVDERRRLRDSAYASWRKSMPQKLDDGQVVDLNCADTLRLQAVPGVGPYFAGRIVAYGNQLGGYVSARQLLEISGFPQEALKWFTVEGKTIRKLRVNHDEFKMLVHHPYLSFEQVKAIFNHRRKYGDLSSLRQLSTEPAFTEADLERLRPYVSFD